MKSWETPTSSDGDKPKNDTYGTWLIASGEWRDGAFYFQCSICKGYSPVGAYPFCPWCGKPMKQEKGGIHHAGR